MRADLGERLLASYADLGEAMVAKSFLEAQGIPCRTDDLANLASHALGIAGSLGRSVGLWVLEADVERAVSLLAGATSENLVDEDALAAEAIAAGEEGETEGRARDSEKELQADEAIVGAPGGPLPIAPAHSPWFARAVFASVVAIIALLVSRGCR